MERQASSLGDRLDRRGGTAGLGRSGVSPRSEMFKFVLSMGHPDGLT